MSPLKRNRSSSLSKTHRDDQSPYWRMNTDLNSTKFQLKKGGTVKKVRHLESPEFIVEQGGALVPYSVTKQPDYTVRQSMPLKLKHFPTTMGPSKPDSLPFSLHAIYNMPIESQDTDKLTERSNDDTPQHHRQ